jgi:hypothetical protein
MISIDNDLFEEIWLIIGVIGLLLLIWMLHKAGDDKQNP